MNKIPEDLIERIRDAANIVDIIGEEVSLKRAGANMKGLCPFHNDRHASLMVSPSKQIFKCFACGEGGNVFDWYMKLEHISFPEAVRKVAAKVGIEVPDVQLSEEEQHRNDDRQSCLAVLVAAQNLMEGALATNDSAREYLKGRGTSEDMISKYGLGYAPGGDYLTKALLSQGYKEEFLLMSGVSVKNERGRLRDKFFNRITFPYYDRRGQIVGFTGRDLSGTSPAKYLNTEETILFTKGNQLYGFFQARQAIAKAGFAYVVEGQFDVISMVQAGIENIVAGSGTAFTEAQRKLLHSITTDLVFVYDDDRAGHAAAVKQIKAAVEQGFCVRCVLMTGGMDPDDLARELKDETPKWMEEHICSYVDAMIIMKWGMAKGASAEGRVLKEICGIIAQDAVEYKIPLIRELAEHTRYKVSDIEALLMEIEVLPKPDERVPGFHGWEFAEDLVDPTERTVNVTPDWEKFQRSSDGKTPWLFLQGTPSMEQYQELNRKVHHIVFHNCMPAVGKDSMENDDLKVMETAYKMGLTVDQAIMEEGRSYLYGFLYLYARLYGELIEKTSPTPEQKNVYLGRVAEMISYAPDSIQTVHMQTWAEMLGLKTTALKELVKPFNAERKAARRIAIDMGDIGEEVEQLDSERIPDYVNNNDEYKSMLRRYNFYPVLGRKSGEPVCYMFRNSSGQLKRVADFYMEPLFHVYSQESSENRRVVKLTSLYKPGCKYVEITSKSFQKLSTLDERLIEEGAYNFENGTAEDYAKIRAWMSYRFPTVDEIKVLGQQNSGSFVWANAIYREDNGKYELVYANELGLLPDGEKIYYSPAYSKVNIGISMDADPYEQDRWLTYEDVPDRKRISFGDWASLMHEVYKVNNNGDFAIIYAVMCAFRSVIFRSLPNPFFTSIFFIGPTMSGKTQIALSIRALFIKPEYPSFNLNSGTDAAFFSVLERFRDVPQVMEEYNDEEISDQKFQGLKSVTYDGDGKQKRKSATGNAIDTSKVNAPVIILGQEAPSRDDGALANRVVLCEVPIREDINEDHTREVFEKLKDYESNGLSYLLLDILKLRPIFKQKFGQFHKECVREVQREVESNGNRSGNQTRIINTVSMFLTTVKILTSFAPHLQLPFTYDEFRRLCIDKVRSQVDMITSSNKLAAFFDIMDILIDKPSGGIKIGRDFRIVTPRHGEVKLKGGKVYNPPTDDTQLIYMRLDPIHQAYMKAFNGDHPLSKTTLMMNLRSDSAYIGEVSAYRFEWDETVERSSSVVSEEDKDRVALRYIEKRQTMTSAVVMNYTQLKQHYAKDFERTT